MATSPRVAAPSANRPLQPEGTPADVYTPVNKPLVAGSPNNTKNNHRSSSDKSTRARLTQTVTEATRNFWNKLSAAASDFQKKFPQKTWCEQRARVELHLVSVNFKELDRSIAQCLDALKIIYSYRSKPRESPVSISLPFSKSPNDVDTSNHFRECEKNLVQGIESGQGVYQFVSRKAHFLPAESNEKPIISTLIAQWNSSKEKQSDLILGGRFKVVSIEPNSWPPAVREGRDYNTRDKQRTCALTVVGIDDDKNDTAKHRRIPLTQVGLKFTDKLLREHQICHARVVVKEHLEKCIPPLPGAQRQFLPMIASAANRGRGPTLIAFDYVMSQIENDTIKDEASIDTALNEIITAGRKARIASDLHAGRKPDLSGFVHSAAQLQELQTALRGELTSRRANSMLTSGRGARNRASTALNRNRFQILTNAGGGSCLFHSLEGTASKPSLTAPELVALRGRVAAVLEAQKETPEQKRRNGHEIKSEAQRQNHPIPDQDEVDNSVMANHQRNSSYFAGDMEIEQWLTLPENVGKTVVCIDTKRDCEQITIVSAQPLTRIDLREIALAKKPKDEIDKELDSQIVAAIYGTPIRRGNDGKPIIPENRIVIYRTTGHFERIIGT